jgi:hypothetical protein
MGLVGGEEEGFMERCQGGGKGESVGRKMIGGSGMTYREIPIGDHERELYQLMRPVDHYWERQSFW